MTPSELMELIGDRDQTFWRILQRLVTEKLPPVPVPPPVVILESTGPMLDGEARAFEQLAMPFGLHAGRPVGEIPPDYLIFMAEGTEFTKKLKRYCASQMFFKRQKWDNDEYSN